MIWSTFIGWGSCSQYRCSFGICMMVHWEDNLPEVLPNMIVRTQRFCFIRLISKIGKHNIMGIATTHPFSKIACNMLSK